MNRDLPESSVGREPGSIRHRKNAAAAILVGGAFIGSLLALPDPEPVVVTHPVVERPIRYTGGMGAVPPASSSSGEQGSQQQASQGVAGAASAETVPCTGPNPGPSWGCHDGVWRLGPPPVQSGGGRIDRAAGCLSEQPGPSFVCRDGSWTIASSEPAAAPTASTATRRDADGTTTCAAPSPGAAFTCVNGTWEPSQPSPAGPATADSPARPAVISE